MGAYELHCAVGGELLEPGSTGCERHAALARTKYARELIVRDLPGLWRFVDWLPVSRELAGVSPGSICYKSEAFAKELRLKDLWISFSGYWPERGGACPTCTFKDLEAAPTVMRLTDLEEESALVVASAGNTGKAFAHVSCILGRPVVLVVPISCFEKLWIPRDDPDHGGLFVVGVNGDYADAIDLADRLAKLPGFVPEGGARNLARRDGMGTVMLEGTTRIGRLPDHYFQAVGSGTGGIAAWEASLRLIADGRFGETLPNLNLAQNLPCAPLLSRFDGTKIHEDCPEGMFDLVLYNRRPPYEIGGGVRDALRATHGIVVGATNLEAQEARMLFQGVEGIDIVPAAAIAVAALMEEVERGAVDRESTILLNITGGGEARLHKEIGTKRLPCQMKVDAKTVDFDALAGWISEYLAAREKVERGGI
jgi:cysteate synthase